MKGTRESCIISSLDTFIANFGSWQSTKLASSKFAMYASSNDRFTHKMTHTSNIDNMSMPDDDDDDDDAVPAYDPPSSSPIM